MALEILTESNVKDPKQKAQEVIVEEETEKALIRRYFDEKPNGVVVEVGANEPVSIYSQSWHLEDKLGWRAVLVEPNPELAEKARKLRSRAQVFEFACVGSEEIHQLSLFIPLVNGEEVTGHAAIEKNIDDHAYHNHREVVIRAQTLNQVIESCGSPQIDVLSIDVEGAEIEVLKGLDLARHRPRLILLEDKHVYLTKHRLLKKNGYRLVKRTGLNCWYVPVDAKRPEQTPSEKIRLMRRLYLSIWWKKLKLAIRERSLQPVLSL